MLQVDTLAYMHVKHSYVYCAWRAEKKKYHPFENSILVRFFLSNGNIPSIDYGSVNKADQHTIGIKTVKASCTHNPSRFNLSILSSLIFPFEQNYKLGQIYLLPFRVSKIEFRNDPSMTFLILEKVSVGPS